jgi:hypothetical protein
MADSVHLPPGPRWPVAVQGIGYLAARRRLMQRLHKRYGRAMLREFRLVPTHAPGERLHNRGVAFSPSEGGRAVVYRRARNARSASDQQRQPAVAG